MANDLDNIVRLQKALETLIAKASLNDDEVVTSEENVPEVTPQPEEDNNLLSVEGQVLNEHSDDEMRSLEVVMEVGKKDKHGNFYTAETLEGAEASFKRNDVPSNLFHLADTESFDTESTFLLEEDTHYETIDKTVLKGSWMAWLKFNDTELWELKKSNQLGGLSPKCLASVNETTGEITNIAFSVEDSLAYREET